MLKWWRDAPEVERVLGAAFILFIVMGTAIAVGIRRDIKEQRAAKAQRSSLGQ